MHVRTQLRTAMRDRLKAAQVAGGNVLTHDPRLIGQTAYPLVVIDPEMEPSITPKGPRIWSARVQDGKKTGRPLIRKIQASIKIYAADTGAVDTYGNLVSADTTVHADHIADDIAAAIEESLFDGVSLVGEIDLVLLGTGGMPNPETGKRLIGAIHMLVEATVMTDEGDATVVSNRL